MYDNIGGKIKGLTKIIFYVFSGIYILGGLVFCFMGEGVGVVIGLPIMIVGPLLAWVFSWFMYGYGELIEKTTEIAKNTRPGAGGAPASNTGTGTAAYTTAMPAAQKPDPADKIGQLDSLRAQGLISEDEYQQLLAKAEEEMKK